MEAFRVVMQVGTITGAARVLNISQPSVTNLIKGAESRSGIKLFNRIKGRLEPTPEALILFDEIEKAFSHIHLVNLTIDGIRSAKVGSLSVASFPLLASSFIPTAIGKLLQLSPDIHVSYITRGPRQLLEAVTSRAVDIGFGFFIEIDQRVKHIKLARSKPICIFPANSPLAELDVISPRDLRNHRMIGYTETQMLSGIVKKAFQKAGVRPECTCIVESIHTAWEMARAGAGVAIVDPYSVAPGSDGKVIHRIFECDDELTLDAIVRSESTESIIVKKFIELVQGLVVSMSP